MYRVYRGISKNEDRNVYAFNAIASNGVHFRVYFRDEPYLKIETKLAFNVFKRLRRQDTMVDGLCHLEPKKVIDTVDASTIYLYKTHRYLDPRSGFSRISQMEIHSGYIYVKYIDTLIVVFRSSLLRKWR